MSRKKQEETEEVLNRHPHADADEVECLEEEFDSEFEDVEAETAEEAEEESVDEIEETENAEDAEISSDDESEDSEDEEDEEENEFEKADREFMDSVTAPKKTLSPEQVKAKKETLETEIDELKDRVEVLEQIENLKKHIGWEYAIEDLKEELCRFVEAEKVDNLKKSTKGLEAALAAREFLGKFSSELYSKKCEIKSKENEIEELKRSAVQIGLFDEDVAEESAEVEQTDAVGTVEVEETEETRLDEVIAEEIEASTTEDEEEAEQTA